MAAEPSGPKVGFIDTSQWRGHVDCRQVAASGKVGVWPRTTSGTSLDPYWADTCQGALVNNLVVAARHRLYGSPSCKTQFDAFAREAERVVPGARGILISLDSEDDASWAQVTEFEQRAFDRWGVWLVGYYPCWWLPRVGNPTIRKEVTWWHSRYASSPGELCGGRTSLAGQCWQYSDSGSVPGVQGPCDLNWFYGTREQLQAKAVGEGGLPDEATLRGLLQAELEEYRGRRPKNLSANPDNKPATEAELAGAYEGGVPRIDRTVRDMATQLERIEGLVSRG